MLCYVTYNSLTKDPKISSQEKSFWPNQKLVHAFFLLEESNVQVHNKLFTVYNYYHDIFSIFRVLVEPKSLSFCFNYARQTKTNLIFKFHEYLIFLFKKSWRTNRSVVQYISTRNSIWISEFPRYDYLI